MEHRRPMVLARLTLLLAVLFGLVGLAPQAAMATTTVTAMVAGSEHTCALTSGGGVICTGANSNGQLGNNSTTASSTLVNVSSLSSGVIAIAAGGDHTCALTSGGAVKCWGANYSGQLGDGTTTNRTTPVSVSGLSSGVTAIAAGAEFTCAIVSGGAKCWGSNWAGQVGDNTTTDRYTPTSVNGLSSGVTTITGGGFHTCALVNGGVKCWGYNPYGQVGDGTTSNRSTPTSVNGLASGVSLIDAGFFHTCAVVNGGAKCWGYNANGQLGDNSTTHRNTPVNVNSLSSGVSAIAGGSHHTCAVTSGGGLKCWGYNPYGQLGNYSTTDSSVPVNVKYGAGPSDITSGGEAIIAGGYRSCAIVSGAVRCWGSNNAGQFGDGSTNNSSKAVDISGLDADFPVTSGQINSPKTDDHFGQAMVNFKATASETGSGVDEVRFYVEYGGSRQLAGTDSVGASGTYSVTWETPKTLSTQTITFSIDVVDNNGSIATNADVEVTHFIATVLNPNIDSSWVPAEAYLNQRALDSTNGNIMCNGASATMLLGLNGFINPTFAGMEDKAQSIYTATEPNGFPANQIEAEIRGYNGATTEVISPSVYIDLDGAWDVITETIDSGHPIMSGTYIGVVTPQGHYIVIVGYNQNGTGRQIIAYDPFGHWRGGSPVGGIADYDLNLPYSDANTQTSHVGRWVYYDFDSVFNNNYFIRVTSP